MAMNNFVGTNTGSPIGMTPNFVQIQQTAQIDTTQYLINYNDHYCNSQPAMFRDCVIAQTMGVLIGKDKPNPLLIGAAGVGKTKIVEEIARLIATKDPRVPDALRSSVIWELPLSNLVAGSGIVGELEEKVKSVIDFISDPTNHAILFIDEIHQLGNNRDTSYSKIAQILKPALSRGEIHVIGATTTQEAKMLQSDPALNRRFSRIIVDEFSRDQTVQILKAVKKTYIKHYGNITINDNILPETAAIADQYANAGNHRPDTALTLLDRACADAIIARKIKENQVKNDPVMLQALQANPIVSVNESQLKSTAIKIMTGHARKENLDEDFLRDKLSKIKGQDSVLTDVIKRLMQHDKGLFPRNTPLTFLFAGPSGVGKTEVTKIIAEVMTDTRPITLSMPEFHSPASINRIIGSPAGYVGSDSNAELPFDCLTTNPYQVILLDEFEKADKSVQRLFMGAFDEGYIKTAKGNIVDFSKTIIIATTNASHTTGATKSIGFNNRNVEDISQKDTINDLNKWFDIELLNRFNEIYTFNSLNEQTFKDIIQAYYQREISRIKTEHRSITAPDKIPDTDLDALAKKFYIERLGARPARKAVEEYIQEII